MTSTETSATPLVKSRLVLNFPGFEKTDSEAQLGRLLYGGENTGKLWGFTVNQEEVVSQEVLHHSEAVFSAKGGNWDTQTKVVQFRWNDIVHTYENAPFPGGFLRDLNKFAKFFFDGTVWKYRRASGRYFTFTIFPLLLAAVFAIASWFVFGALINSTILQIVLTVFATLCLCKWPGVHLYVPLTIADWGFARDMVDQCNGEIESRFAEFADSTFEQISNSSHDEIILVGHSFGAVWAVAALSGALERDPDLLKNKKVSFLALGSSIPKIALTPSAEFLRKHVARVVSEENLFWHEIQTKDDLIAFYKSHPFEVLELDSKCQLAIDRIRFSKGMEKKRYKSMRRSFYRTHRQYILYYDKRVGFDYLIRVFGPLAVPTLASLDDAPSAIDKNGRLL